MRVEFIFKLHRSKTPKQQWYWRCKASNGELRCDSPLYATKGGCYNAIKVFVRKMLPGVAVIDETWREKRGIKRKTV